MLSDKELTGVNGGSKLGIAGGIIAIITFLIGVVDGYQRPLECNY